MKLGYSEPEACSDPCKTSTMERFEKQLTAIIILVSYNYFCIISVSCHLVHEINMIFLTQVLFKKLLLFKYVFFSLPWWSKVHSSF